MALLEPAGPPPPARVMMMLRVMPSNAAIQRRGVDGAVGKKRLLIVHSVGSSLQFRK